MWVFFWGTKTKETQLGMGYFNCPDCKRRQPAKVCQVQTKQHIYFFPVGSGVNVGSEFYYCKVCKRRFTNDGQYGYDFGQDEATRDWKCFKCGRSIPYERMDCPQCGFRFMG
jgi:DNA-directed RNA polymerase subunit RPC12/RpoP